MSDDENSSANNGYEGEEEESHISYRSMEEEYHQQQLLPDDDEELFNSSSDDESTESDLANNDDADDAKRLSNVQKVEKLQAEQRELKKGQEKTIDIVPKAIKTSAISSFNNVTISNDLFKACCANQCCLKISSSHESCNFEPCMQFIRERRKDLFGKSSSEQIALLKTYIYNSMHRKSPVHNSSSNNNNNMMESNYYSGGRMNFDYMVEGHSFCGRGFCNVFGISNYLRKRLVTEIKDGFIGVTYLDMEGKKLTTIDSEAVQNITKLLNDHKILISNSMRSNLSIPDSAEIGLVRNIRLLKIIFVFKF